MRARNVFFIVAALWLAYFAYTQWSGSDSGDDSSDAVGGSLDDLYDDFTSSSSTDDSSTGATDVTTSGSVATDWARAIQTFEGYFPGSRAYRNNNPGNIVGSGDAGSDADGYAKYSSYAAGFQALVSDLTAKLKKYPGFSITQIMARYAPADDGTKLNAGNNPNKYATFVANYLNNIFGGISTNTTLSQLAGLGS